MYQEAARRVNGGLEFASPAWLSRHLLPALIHADHQLREDFCEPYIETLHPSERAVQAWVDALPLESGCWYRPSHNMIVPLAMMAICTEESLPRDLVLAAQLHDIGYSGQRIENSDKGPAWEATQMRLSHMEAGASKSGEFLRSMNGNLGLSEQRIAELVEAIGRHDLPYIGVALEGREELALRDADRAFVMSAISFWKDYIANTCNGEHCAMLGEHELWSPEHFVSVRLKSFYSSVSELPSGWNEETFPFRPELQTIGQPYPEAPSTALGRKIVSEQFLRRAAEAEEISRARSTQEVEGLLDLAIASDFQFFLSLAAEGKKTLP